MNETILQFDYPNSLIYEYDYWVVLMRPQQVTVGSLILACKGEYQSLAEIPGNVYSELTTVTSDIEKILSKIFDYDRINYLLLMMRDKYVHFHVIPRYSEAREVDGMRFEDKMWPMPPDITRPLVISDEEMEKLRKRIKSDWIRQDNN